MKSNLQCGLFSKRRTWRYRRLALIPAVLIAVSTQAATAVPAVPGFRQLEADYGAGGGIAAASIALGAVLPPGTILAVAQHSLADAGADCRPIKRDPETLKCLIHRYSLADGAADDIRWTVRVHSSAGVVTDLTVDRYVDRHGSN